MITAHILIAYQLAKVRPSWMLKRQSRTRLVLQTAALNLTFLGFSPEHTSLFFEGKEVKDNANLESLGVPSFNAKLTCTTNLHGTSQVVFPLTN